jgi:hypothetical protein
MFKLNSKTEIMFKRLRKANITGVDEVGELGHDLKVS